MKRYLYLISFYVPLLLLSWWLVCFGLDHRRVYFGSFEESEIKALSHLPGVLYTYGEYVWKELDTVGAVETLRQVVSRDPLHMDAWLKLAETEIEIGNDALARDIAEFCHSKISGVLRWKQPHTLLAHDLGLKDIFKYNLNYLVDRKKWLTDIFYLLDAHTDFQTDQALELLARGNRAVYLAWLMRWKRSGAARTTWEAIERDGDVTDDLLLDYVHFLLSQKHVTPATALWQRHSRIYGMTNAGFENKIKRRGFGWRMSDLKDEKTLLCRRVYGQSHSGRHALSVSFHGKENLAWHDIYQIVPVKPGQPYELKYWWKSKSISTDQGPFVEISCYDVKGLYKKGPMALGGSDWALVNMGFTPPMDCHAVVVRLRRNYSLRFDNKIQGVLWVDDFSMETLR